MLEIKSHNWTEIAYQFNSIPKLAIRLGHILPSYPQGCRKGREVRAGYTLDLCIRYPFFYCMAGHILCYTKIINSSSEWENSAKVTNIDFRN